jgi:glycine/D-amino acid oxidase-like deaminating enzyme
MQPTCEALVIGAGFYGAEIALELRRIGFDRVVVAEREPGILRRASYVNQARVHNGYHYPRSLGTAERSRINFETFVSDYAPAVLHEMEAVYAIAAGSRVSAAQFETFCRVVGASCRPAPGRIAALFEPGMVEEAFLTRELAFDARRLAGRLLRALEDARVDLRLGQEARVLGWDGRHVEVAVGERVERAAYVFNCTYSELEFTGAPLRAALKRELAEMLLIEPPPALRGVGITVMDGPFFSTMPFPAEGLHSLSHVSYTPHESAVRADGLSLRPVRSNRDAILRDAQRFLPCLAQARVARSIFEVKAILMRNEADDGRPILMERNPAAPRILSVLGAKIDNIYDVRAFLRAQDWDMAA